MAINCQTLLDDIGRSLGQGVSGTRITETFVTAVNSALDELSNEADLATRLTHITATDSSQADLGEHYRYILYAGVYYWMIRLGIRPADPRIAKVLFEDSERSWKEAKADYVVAEDNSTQSDSDNDIWGLGALG